MIRLQETHVVHFGLLRGEAHHSARASAAQGPARDVIKLHIGRSLVSKFAMTNTNLAVPSTSNLCSSEPTL